MKNTRQTTYFPLMGGEDLATPLFSKPPGTLKRSENFECDLGGRYRRIDGYERFDGHTSPSEASYWILNFDAGDAEISEGDTVTGATSGATGKALIDGVLDSGSYAGNDGDGYIVLTGVSGTFQNNENLQVSAVTVCVADGTASELTGTSDNHTTWIRDAIETARADISAVPGSGDILGVNVYNGTGYAFRADSGATEVCMYKSTTSGWSKVSLGSEISFDAGTAALTEGGTLTGGTSSATGTIGRVVVQSGAWDDNDATGYISFTPLTGTFQNDETITDGSGGSATSDGTASATSLNTGGRFEFDNNNFGAHSGTFSMYGCDGANYAFEYTGTAFTRIKTGMTTDTPSHIAVHKNHLFLSFPGGSVQHSSIGVPLIWSAVTGASELGMGDEVISLTVMPGDTLAIFSRNRISILYGTGASDWNLKSFSRDVGAIEWSVQRLTDSFFLDDKGVTNLSTVQSYGDFKAATLSRKIQKLIEDKKDLFVASVRVKNKNQYRMYFSDNTGICMTIVGNEVLGFTRLNYIDAITCTFAGQDSSGNEMLLFGSDDGMVYELDKGTSFDGDAVRCYLRTWLNTLKSPERKKRFFKVMVEKDNILTEGYWGLGSWGGFEWGDQGYEPPASYIDETDVGYEYSYTALETHEAPYTLQGVVVHYSNGGLKR